MTPNNIDIQAKSDRELLIMIADKLNQLTETQGKHHDWIEGAGIIPGAKIQVWVLWAVFLAIVAKIF